MSKYLKKESYYIDLYDLFTIQRCLRYIESWDKAFKEKSNSEELKKYSAEEKKRYSKSALNMALFHIKGERYKGKSSTASEWMNRDRGLDEKLDNEQEPRNADCPRCGNKMDMIFKELHDLRVLFFFECPKCKKRKGIFDNGEPFVSRPQYCPECKKEIKVSCVKKGETLKWVTDCKSCGYKEVEIDDFEKDKAARLEREAKDRELLRKHRTEFCMSDAEGQEYVECMERMESLAQYMRELEQKRADPDYERASKLNKLSVVELEKLITETAQKEKYVKLMLEKPNIDRYVTVPFTMQDSDSSRTEIDSVRKLGKTIKKALENTNWRLMSEGIDYRLGYLSGKFKGYEQEEDLLKLVKAHKINKTA